MALLCMQASISGYIHVYGPYTPNPSLAFIYMGSIYMFSALWPNQLPFNACMIATQALAAYMLPKTRESMTNIMVFRFVFHIETVSNITVEP